VIIDSVAMICSPSFNLVSHILLICSPCSEVRQSLSTAQSQYSQWCMLLDGEVEMDKIQGVASELRNCIKSIEWDLEDLEQTISILLIPSL